MAVMAKAPRVGDAKTRLVPPLSPAEAAALSGCFIRDIAANIWTAAEARRSRASRLLAAGLGGRIRHAVAAGSVAAVAPGRSRREPVRRRRGPARRRLRLGLPGQFRQPDPADRACWSRRRGRSPRRGSPRPRPGRGRRLLPDRVKTGAPPPVRGYRLEHRAGIGQTLARAAEWASTVVLPGWYDVDDIGVAAPADADLGVPHTRWDRIRHHRTAIRGPASRRTMLRSGSRVAAGETVPLFRSAVAAASRCSPDRAGLERHASASTGFSPSRSARRGYAAAAWSCARRRVASRRRRSPRSPSDAAGRLSAPPYLSTDIYRYVWDGRVIAAGINPYRYIPADPHLEGLRDPEIFPQINRANYAPTIYPPAARRSFSR